MNRWTLYAVSVAGTTVDGITNQNVDPGLIEEALGADGAVDPTFGRIRMQNPTITFTTTALKKALDACGISGLAISATPVILWFQGLSPLGDRTSGNTHIKLTVARGLLVPRTLRASRDGGAASIDYALHCVWNGTTDPVAVAAGQALAGTPTVDQVFTVGPVRINSGSVAIDNVQDIAVDFGLQVSLGTKDGEVWPRDACILARRPTIRVTTFDATVLSTYGFAGVAQGGTDSEVWLRKCSRLGARVADTTPEHIKIAIDDGRISPLAFGGGAGPAEGGLLITPLYDGSAAIMAITTAAAITGA